MPRDNVSLAFLFAAEKKNKTLVRAVCVSWKEILVSSFLRGIVKRRRRRRNGVRSLYFYYYVNDR
jgi:hypothetical protein